MQSRDIDSCLGAQIRVVTTFGEEIEGELFCIDTSGSQSVVICQRIEPSGNVNYKWIKINIIREVSATAGPASGASEEWFPHVDLQQIASRAKKSEDEAREDVKRYGVGVTEHMQEVFDALAKTYEAVWNGQEINLPALGITISKEGESIEGGAAEARERVQKVLGGGLERQRAKKQAASGK